MDFILSFNHCHFTWKLFLWRNQIIEPKSYNHSINLKFPVLTLLQVFNCQSSVSWNTSPQSRCTQTLLCASAHISQLLQNSPSSWNDQLEPEKQATTNLKHHKICIPGSFQDYESNPASGWPRCRFPRISVCQPE